MELNLIGDMVAKWSVYYPDKLAIICEEKGITYAQLKEGVNRAANCLSSRGIKNGDRVSLLLYNCIEYVELFIALSKIGAISCPMSARLTPSEIQYQLNDSGSSLLLFDEELIKTVEEARSKMPLEENGYWCVGNNIPEWAVNYKEKVKSYSVDEPNPMRPIDWEDAQIIMYTSGTTGSPKGAVTSHRKTFFNMLNAHLYHEIRFEDIVLSPYPLFHSAGLLIYTMPFLSRGCTVILRRKYTPEKMLQDIEKYKVTMFGAVTTVLKQVLDTGLIDKYDIGSIRIFGGGGEKTSIDLIDKLAAKGLYLQQRMGQTETSTLCSVPGKDALRKKGSIGLPVFYADVRIVDENGKEMPPGERGEIVVKGPTLMSGYWNKPEETAQTIVDGVLHTGDVAFKDEDGFVYIVDRVKDMYRSGGENVYPAEIEKILLAHPKISQVAIIGVPDEKWTEVGKAFILPSEGHKISKEEILEFLQGKVAKFKIPAYVEFVDSLPRTAAGKIKKVELKNKFGSAASRS
jgi:fatty-acyl-CoA synthase